MPNIFAVTYFVTNKCNLSCDRCFNKGRDTKELKWSEIRGLCKTLPKFYRLQLSGGEPFLRNDLVDLCDYFSEYNGVKLITIPTNGLLTENIPNFTRRFLMLRPNVKLHISISLNDPKYFPISTWEILKQIQFRDKNLTLGITLTQTIHNEHNLDKLYDFAMDKEPDNFAFNIARLTDKPNPEIYLQFTKKLSKTLPKFPFPMNYIYKAKRNLVFKYVHKVLLGEKINMPCLAGGRRFVIDTDGSIHKCEMKLFGGNCNNCWHECDMETNILFNPKYWLELIREVFR